VALTASRHPSKKSDKKINATQMKLNAVPWLAITRKIIPTKTVETTTTYPLDTFSKRICFHVSNNHPQSKPAKNGHMVETMPPKVIPCL